MSDEHLHIQCPMVTLCKCRGPTCTCCYGCKHFCKRTLPTVSDESGKSDECPLPEEEKAAHAPEVCPEHCA